MDAETMTLIGATLGSSALTTLLWFGLGSRRRKEQPPTREAPKGEREVVKERRTPTSPAPQPDVKIDRALSRMFYEGGRFATMVSEQNRAVRRNKKDVREWNRRYLEQARLKVRREVGL